MTGKEEEKSCTEKKCCKVKFDIKNALTAEEVKRLSAFMAALDCDNRIRIFEELKEGEKCACKLIETSGLSQPTIAHHMKILSDAGLVDSRKEGRWVHYSQNKNTVKEITALLQRLTHSD